MNVGMGRKQHELARVVGELDSLVDSHVFRTFDDRAKSAGFISFVVAACWGQVIIE